MSIQSITSDIQEQIAKSLPSVVAKELQLVLIKAEEDAKLLKDTQNALKMERTKSIDQSEKINRLTEELAKHSELNAKLADIEQRERNLQVQILTIKLGEADRRTETVREIALSLTRNIEYRESNFSSTAKNLPVTNGGYTNVTTFQDSQTDTITKQAI